MRAALRRLVAVAAIALGGASIAPAPASAAVPPVDFAGVGDWAWPTAARSTAYGGIKLRELRVGFPWDRIEPRAGKRDWDYADALVRYAARDGYDLTFVLNGCAAWSCGVTRAAPVTAAQKAGFQSFVDAAVRRYGAGGAYWKLDRWIRAVPVSWQVWNEVNVGLDWPHPTAAAYAELLVATSRTIKAVDPAARVITAGLAELPAVADGQALVPFLQALEEQPGFRTAADVVAVHGYATDPAGAVRILDATRSVMNTAADPRPIWMTELGWGSSGPAHPFTVEPELQAQYLRQTFDTLLACRARWGLGRAYWFSYEDIAATRLAEADYWGFHTGLQSAAGIAKPAMAEFKQYLGGRPLPGGRGDACDLQGAPELPALAVVDPASIKVAILRAPKLVGLNGPASVEFVSNVGSSGSLECSVSGGPWAGCTSPFVIPRAVEGAGSLSVRAALSGGVVSAAATTSWVVDRTPPKTVFLKTPPKQLRSRQVLAVLGTQRKKGTAARKEPVTYICKLSSEPWRRCDTRYRSRAKKVGRQILRVSAIDAAGNVDVKGAKAVFTLTRAVAARAR